MNSPISAELVRRCEERRLCTATTAAAAILGETVDAGVISLADLLDLVRSCSTADELGDALTMLAASVYCLIPPPAGRKFRIIGIPEHELEIPTGGAPWTR